MSVHPHSASSLISRAGIAAAARVSRPLVTMWQERARVRGEDIPFPDPVSGNDLFDLDAVIAWQARTGRGKNPEFAEDAPLHAVEVAVDGTGDPLTALLALAGASGLDLNDAGADALIEASHALDPQDVALRSEVAVGALDPGLVKAAGRLMDASYGGSHALERLLERRAMSGADRSWLLTQGCIDFLARLTTTLSPQSPAVAEAIAAEPSDLALRIALSDDERGIGWVPPAAPVGGVSSADDSVRRQRRQALAAGVAPAARAGATLVAQLPHRTGGSSAPVHCLSLLDDLALEMGPGRVAVVIAPASVLTDRVADPSARRIRDDVLRTGRLRAAVRLPAGLLVDRPRTRLALWVVADADAAAAVGDRPFVTGDITKQEFANEGGSSLIADLVAALEGSSSVKARAFAHCQVRTTASVLATDDALIRLRADAGPRPAPASAAVELMQQLDRLRSLGTDVDLDTRPGHAEEEPPEWSTIDELVASTQVRLLPGRRLAGLDLGEGSVRVIGPPEVCGEDRGLGVSPLLARTRVRGDWTEPGDVVFIAKPSPRAVVDTDGGSLVEYPARVLRGLGDSASACSSVINRLPAAAGLPGGWRLPVLSAEVAVQLAATLRELQHHRARLSEALAALTRVEHTLIDGAASGDVVIEPRRKD